MQASFGNEDSLTVVPSAITVVPSAIAQGDFAGGPDLAELLEESNVGLCTRQPQIEPWDLNAEESALDDRALPRSAVADLLGALIFSSTLYAIGKALGWDT